MIKALIEKEVARQVLRFGSTVLLAWGVPTEFADGLLNPEVIAWVAGVLGYGTAEVAWLLSKKFKK